MGCEAGWGGEGDGGWAGEGVGDEECGWGGGEV